MPDDPQHIYYRCSICDGRAWYEVLKPKETLQTRHCLRCGEYKVNPAFRLTARKAGFTETQIANASGYTRENPGTIWSAETLGQLQCISTPSVAEKAGKILNFAKSKNPIAGQAISLDNWSITRALEGIANIQQEAFPTNSTEESLCKAALPLLAAAWAQSQREVEYLIFKCLFESGYLTKGPADGLVEITPRGWKYLEERPDLTGKICFVAMWFDPSTASAYSGAIYLGIQRAGYLPFRVDNKEHNNDITDEILAGIRRAKFILADFTGQRGGVYYEAGFAHGLGKPVVRTVREDDAKKLHFDTRQINHILWKADDLPEFARAITDRIVATIGQGPLAFKDEV